MPIWSWRSHADGSVEVDRARGAGFERLTSEPHPQVVETQRRVLQWAPLAAEAAAKHEVPLSWILAFVFAESGGRADADNAPDCGGTGCVGLMAIHWAVHGQSREAMLDPEKNLDYGTSLLAESLSRGYDLPAAASIHVAGGGTAYRPHSGTCCSAKCKPECGSKCSEHPDHPEGSPFGMCEHMFTSTQGDGAVGYIDRIVRANNSFIDLLLAADTVAPPLPTPVPAPAPGLARAGLSGASLAAFAAAGMLGYLAVRELSARLRSGR